MKSSHLQNLLLRRDKKAAEVLLQRLGKDENWSAVSLIDEMLPGLLFEANLTYGNFHQVKMALYLRRLIREKKLSRRTELTVLELLIEETLRRSWVNIEAGEIALAEKAENPLTAILGELAENNLHNAFYYALQAYQEKPEELQDLLLCLGGVYGPENLGHSLSCFFPVLEEMVNSHNPATETAILSYLSYLNRYDIPADFSPEDYQKTDMPENSLRLAASGQGIVNLHHMITLVTYWLWEKADFHDKNFPLPYRIYYQKRLADKGISSKRLKRVKEPLQVEVPGSYEEFRQSFNYDNIDHTTRLIRALWQDSQRKAWDWVCRLYAEDYEPGTWNPHFFTGIYLAFRLNEENLSDDKSGKEMAIDQAVEYYLNSVNY